MNIDIITLEIADNITHFAYYDMLVSDAISKSAGSYDEQNKIREKSKKHMSEFFADANFYNTKKQLKNLPEMKDIIQAKIAGMKEDDVEDFVENLKKDSKKIKKLYKSLLESKK
ncbi:hypothetical protein BDD43_4506 [Mucilaginibacter gracilis]|uniref:Uncharacterized protein n=1 Tax=Mucilaginibacter gracilis TaxID=423350 RepID=A0A495J7D8_9SPHI|nr:hypothetical protein [Mucilaginibacter gracilis]RKR84274.1 hypothetical protein BDD43_4506 [Mucilaginibacter gracilis]